MIQYHKFDIVIYYSVVYFNRSQQHDQERMACIDHYSAPFCIYPHKCREPRHISEALALGASLQNLGAHVETGP
jgi:hypothetical protein